MKLKLAEDIKKHNGGEERECPICKYEKTIHIPLSGGITRVLCYRCGVFEITDSLTAELKNDKDLDILLLLSFLLRRGYEERKGDEYLKLNTYNIGLFKKEAAENVPKHNEKFTLLLKAIERIQSYTGEKIYLRKNSLIQLYLSAMSYSKSEEELNYLIEGLSRLGYIEISSYGVAGSNNISSFQYITLTPEGYHYLAELERTKFESNKIFIAMSFKEELESIFDGIAEVVKDLGYQPIRVDKIHYAGYIMDRIQADIKESKCVIAEVSDQNLNVYFEMGYALGYGIPVIPLLEKRGKDPFEKIPFDLKQYNTIVYETTDDLKEKLYERLRNLFGKRIQKRED